ncbi:MAG: hypothetical protein COV60_01820 [Candidatus Magasanikbacteria bacterium CG11_big_fil_rev_8_21_14_0_20_43_7]|uniref:Uncharacterized protein n=1 Tax=Candidatus Magasanikbacteria bacterium CG11_big_fil_rev_8_21_14_0_20_43_7 TaxID=1974654 RepID=A0A2H0N2N3_9BACT|nr:MAG: hypothetical protein COV60_01820 [Candidatus Magasanikbacteria bacterium CG11_big_fil_rev_8_21_14_0_20_43_7]
MGFFSYLFGTESAYSADMKSLPRDAIRVIVSRGVIRTLDQKEEFLVEDAIDRARRDGKISLQKIDTLLRSLVNQHKISVNDKQGILMQFQQYFESHKNGI